MINPAKKTSVWEARPLLRRRIYLALGIAIAADCLQLALSGFGWVGPDQIIDLVVMFALIPLIGFHWLLLPSFVLELFPVLDDLPTWTACVIAVVAIRRRQFRTLKTLPS